MGDNSSSLYICSSKSILDEPDARQYVNHAEEKFYGIYSAWCLGILRAHGPSAFKSFLFDIILLSQANKSFRGTCKFAGALVFCVVKPLISYFLGRFFHTPGNENAKEASSQRVYYPSKYPHIDCTIKILMERASEQKLLHGEKSKHFLCHVISIVQFKDSDGWMWGSSGHLDD